MTRLSITLLILAVLFLPASEGNAGEDAPIGIPGAGDVASVAILTEQARLMIARHEYGDAQETIDRGLAIRPFHIPLWRLKARAHIAMGQPAEAEEYIRLCLLEDPANPEVNLLALINELERFDLDSREKADRIAGLIEAAGPSLFSDVLAEYSVQGDFAQHLLALLSGWRLSGTPLDGVGGIVRLYANNRIDEAAGRLARASANDMAPNLRNTLIKRLEDALDPDSVSAWSADLGQLSRRDGAYLLEIPTGGKEAFAWLRVSTEWQRITLAVRFGDVPGLIHHIYLRHASSESFLRLSATPTRFLVQEQIPGLGMITIFECSRLLLGNEPIRVRLIGSSLFLFLPPTDSPPRMIPVSPLIAKGRLAFGAERASDASAAAGAAAIFTELSVWHQGHILAEVDIQAADVPNSLLAHPDVTGLLATVGPNQDNDPAVCTLLLRAASAGWSAYAGLPAGSLDLELMRRPVRLLPAQIAERAWTGVVFQLADRTDWTALAAAVDEAADSGLQTAVMLAAGDVDGFLAGSGEWRADWLLLRDPGDIPPAKLAAIGQKSIRVLSSYQVSGADDMPGFTAWLERP